MKFTVTLNHPLQINFVFAPAFRYMEEQHISQFFETGLLRIPSLRKFHEYPDEIRGDKHEGKGSFKTTTVEGGDIIVINDVSVNTYILSTSLKASKKLKEDFQVSSYFRINDPVNFLLTISDAIAGISDIFIGRCNYQEDRLIQRTLKGFSIKEFCNEEGEKLIGSPAEIKRINELTQGGTDLLFLKHDKYESQAELRLAWRVNPQFHKYSEHIDVFCPAALQFCERINELP